MTISSVIDALFGTFVALVLCAGIAWFARFLDRRGRRAQEAWRRRRVLRIQRAMREAGNA